MNYEPLYVLLLRHYCMLEMPVKHFEELRNMLLEFVLLPGYDDVHFV